MPGDGFDQDAWLVRISYGGPLASTLETLRGLALAHAHAIAYESLDIMLGRVPKLGVAELQRKMISPPRAIKSSKETLVITAIVLYDLPPHIGFEECRAHFTKIAPDFLRIPGFIRKQFICARDGKVAGGVYMWESQEAAERFYSGEWLAGIRARYGTEPKIGYFETVALTDKASGQAGGLD